MCSVDLFVKCDFVVSQSIQIEEHLTLHFAVIKLLPMLFTYSINNGCYLTCFRNKNWEVFLHKMKQ